MATAVGAAEEQRRWILHEESERGPGSAPSPSALFVSKALGFPKGRGELGKQADVWVKKSPFL